MPASSVSLAPPSFASLASLASLSRPSRALPSRVPAHCPRAPVPSSRCQLLMGAPGGGDGRALADDGRRRCVVFSNENHADTVVERLPHETRTARDVRGP